METFSNTATTATTTITTLPPSSPPSSSSLTPTNQSTPTTPPTQPPVTWRVVLVSIAFFVLHTLPMLWIIHCACVLLWLFPLTDSLIWNTFFLLLSLLLFIVSGVNLEDYYVRRAIAVAMFASTVHHFIHGHFTPLFSLKNLLYITWIIFPMLKYFSGNLFKIHGLADWYVNLPLWRWVCDEYFPLTVVHDGLEELKDQDPSKKYFFVYHPHGLWPWGMWLSLVTKWKEFYPHVTWRVLTATPLLLLPYIGEYLQNIGGISADWKTCGKAVEAGHSLVVLPGGLAEAMLSDPTHYAILIKPRRGFIKMAIVHGLSLVPVFGFGETKLYHQISACRDLRLQLSRKTGFPITLFAGAYGSTVPRRQPITVVVGKALHVKQDPNPTKEEIEATYNKYEAALVDLYNRYRPKDAGPLVLL